MDDPEIMKLIRKLAGGEDCDYDHHGYCQVHWGSNSPDEKCPHERARHLVAGGERLDLAQAIVNAATAAYDSWDRIGGDPELTQITVTAAGLFDVLVGINLTNPGETAAQHVESLRHRLYDMGKEYSKALRETPEEGT